MTETPDRASDETDRDARSTHEPTDAATIEAYETEDLTVFFDAENPLAWVESARPIVLAELV